MARPPLTSRTVRMDTKAWRAVEAIAQKKETTPSAIVREAINKEIAQNSDLLPKTEQTCVICRVPLSMCNCPKLIS